jgi:N-methylhydantoinase B
MIDPITLSVVRSGLEQICNEMDLQLIRSALSPIISETNDCAHGIYEARTGETVAQGHLGLPMFLANMQFSVQTVIESAEATGGFKPGDVWILNDVYSGGTHLNDVNLVAPVYLGDELFALVASTGHWMDVGGAVPGGWSSEAVEIHQEGMVIPPARLFEDGRRNEGLVSMITANVRIPQQILGDLTAMIGAIRSGEHRLGAMVERHGQETVRGCLAELRERSEQQMRSHIAEIPDGVYRFSDALDNDGLSDTPMLMCVEVTIRDSDMLVDFAGTAPAAKGPMNLSRNSTTSLVYVALKHIFPDVPISGGTFRPVEVRVPAGTITAAEYPSPVGGYLEIAGRVLDVMFGALSQAIPQHVPAAPFGTTGVVTVGGRHPDTKAYFVGVFPYPGGYGGTSEGDGLVNGTPPQSMANFVALEASEHRYPVRFDFFALRENSGGAGRHRGGDGTTYRITTLAPCIVSVLGDRTDTPPFGLGGGGSAAPNLVQMTTAGRDWIPPMRSKVANQSLEAGDAVTVGSPGGGGYGDPLERAVEAVEADLNLGYISREAAERDFGAVVADIRTTAGRPRYRLDPEATRRARENARRLPVGAGAPDTTITEGGSR